MTALLFLFIVLLSVAVLIGAAIQLILLRRTPPIPKPAVDASIPAETGTLKEITAATTGGVFRGLELTIPDGTTVRLETDLIVVTEGVLRVDGDIRLASPAPFRPVSITLVSLNGDVVINGRVGRRDDRPANAPPTPRTGIFVRLSGAAGFPAGFVKVLAPRGSIRVTGTVEGFGGARGGDASATGIRFLRGQFGDRAEAVGGPGGAGGDVLLGALEGIILDRTVQAGDGGGGGIASAIAAGGERATAEGGPSGDGGTVFFRSIDPDSNCIVRLGAARGGSAVKAGSAVAVGGSNRGAGAAAVARGGAGGTGGTVQFTAAVVPDFVPSIRTVESSPGGRGGDAIANGGNGQDRARLRNGGNGTAFGGDGGGTGPLPQVPISPQQLAAGSVATGTTGDGAGGSAFGQAGDGGSGGQGGGASGTATAIGGRGGLTGEAGGSETLGPVAGAPSQGGAGGSVNSSAVASGGDS